MRQIKTGVGPAHWGGQEGYWIQAKVPPWQANVYLVKVGGRWIVAEIHLGPPYADDEYLPSKGPQSMEDVPELSITSRDLRRIPLAEIQEGLERARKDLEDIGRESRLGDSPLGQHRPGRRPDRAHFAKIARLYLDALDRGSRRPLVDVLKELKKQDRQRYTGVTEATVRDWIHAARKRHGFLTAPPKQGVPGGEATPKLLEWEAQEKERRE